MNNAISTSECDIDCFEYSARLLQVCQELRGKKTDVVDHICQEVASITDGSAKIMPDDRFTGKEAKRNFSHLSISFPIQFCGFKYGTLDIELETKSTMKPRLPISIAQHLAQLCGLIFHTLEMSNFLEMQYRRMKLCSDSQINNPIEILSRREHEVLSLMFQGYDNNTIAELLFISSATVEKHKHNIYHALEAHNEHEALLIAYRAGFYSSGEPTR